MGGGDKETEPRESRKVQASVRTETRSVAREQQGERAGWGGEQGGQGLVTEHLRCAGHSKAGEVEEEGTLGPGPACARSEEDTCLPAPAGGGAAAPRGGWRCEWYPGREAVWGRRARARAARSGLSCRPTLCYPSGCPARTEWAHRTLA